MEAAASLKAQLVRAIGDRKRLAILDMSEVEHLDALPLVVIVHAQRTAGDTDSRLVLTGLGGQPREMFDEWAPVPPIEVYPTVQEAVAQLSA